MHPDISRLPSTLFYGERLYDGPGMAEKTSQLWHKHPLFGTYKFINVASGREQQAHSGHSLVNHTECEVAVALYNRIKTEYSEIDLDFRIGVITMYRAQLLELKRKFRAVFGTDIVGKVDFNTVDGFQGQEKDIIILSCVRAGPGVQSVGFLADQRRLNVAITRARASLFILGHAATLERSDPMWKAIVQESRSATRLLDVCSPST
jgi:ATP-dependent RNA/DNA helicase, senataxin